MPSTVTRVLCNSATDPANNDSCDSSNELNIAHPPSRVAGDDSRILISIPVTDGWQTIKLPASPLPRQPILYVLPPRSPLVSSRDPISDSYRKTREGGDSRISSSAAGRGQRMSPGFVVIVVVVARSPASDRPTENWYNPGRGRDSVDLVSSPRNDDGSCEG